ncbi:MAG: beta-N-acetylhexosaminidase [Acetatifactor sp.]|nr:beta-N-acetylhexosaminidase [Acetatifactor sp.]
MYILPQPTVYKENDGEFVIRYLSGIVIDEFMNSELKNSAWDHAGLLRLELEQTIGFQVDIKEESLMETTYDICLVENTALLKEEQYTINVTPEKIFICAGTGTGFLYGIQTMRQIIRNCGAIIPCLEIEDEPEISVRGISYDTTRGRIPTLEELKRHADFCSFYKINQMQLYVEHSFMFRNEEPVWCSSTPLTAEEIIELDDYCSDLNVELVPSLASFGHLYEVLRNPKFSKFCEIEGSDKKPFSLVERMGHYTIDVSNDEAFDFLTGRIYEFMSLFRSKHFNICADETFDLCKGKSKALGDKYGVRRVYVDYLKRLCEFVVKNGCIPMFWGDVLIDEPELIHELPEGSIVLNWEYSPVVKEDNIKKLTDAGIENIYLCPGVQNWNHLINRHADAYKNIRGMCENAHKYHTKGVLCTRWGDLGDIAHPEFSNIGEIYAAAFSWSGRMMEEDEINKAISLIQYGDKTGTLVNTFRELSESENVNWWHAVQFKEEACGQIDITREGYKRLEGILIPEADGKVDVAKVRARIRKNEDALECLYQEMPNIHACQKKDVYAYIVMGEGQRLLSMVGLCIHYGYPLGKNKNLEEDLKPLLPNSLANELDSWMDEYMELWKRTSKSSELYRLEDVIDWYVDNLRTSTFRLENDGNE